MISQVHCLKVGYWFGHPGELKLPEGPESRPPHSFGLIVVVEITAGVVDVVELLDVGVLDSRHSQTEQKLSQPGCLLLQQSPWSYWQPALLLSSSQYPSPAHWGEPQLVGGGCCVGPGVVP